LGRVEDPRGGGVSGSSPRGDEWGRRPLRRWRRFGFDRPELDRQLEEEMELHLELLARELESQGMDAASATAEARRRFGDAAAWAERTRELARRRRRQRRRRGHLVDLVADLRQALRSLRRAPVQALLSVGSLGIGIAAVLVLFLLVDAVLLEPLPYPEPDRLYVIHEASGGYSTVPATPGTFHEWRRQAGAFASLAAFGESPITLVPREGEARRLWAAVVGPGFFRTFGLEPALGRTFTAAEHEQRAPVVVLPHDSWQRQLGGRTDVIGHVLRLDGEPYEVIGVLPPAFDYPRRSEIYLPYRVPDDEYRAHFLTVVGRLGPDVSRHGMVRELAEISTRLATERPETHEGWSTNPIGLQEDLVGELGGRLRVLLGSVALLLALATVNVTGLGLARALARRRDMATRTALGASRARLARLVLAEAAWIALGAGLLAVGLARLGLGLLPVLLPGDAPGLDAVVWSSPAIFIAAGLALLCAFGSSLLPLRLLLADDAGFGHALGAGRGALPTPGRLGQMLVAGQVALALVLALGSGLLARSFERVVAIDPGFDPREVTRAELQLADPRYDSPEARARFYRELRQRADALPGVGSAALVSWLPLEGGWNLGFDVVGRPSSPGARPWAEIRWASPGYFRTLRIPVLAGRGVVEADRTGAEPTVVVSRMLVERIFPELTEELERGQLGGVLGRRLAVDSPNRDTPTERRIVGVVGDIPQHSLTSPRVPTLYVPLAQDPFDDVRLALRTSLPLSELVGPLRRLVGEMDPGLALAGLDTLAERYEAELAGRRSTLGVIATLASLALLLSALGIHGLLAQHTAARRSEIGLRMALGADRASILRWALGRGMAAAAAGMAAGTLLAAGLARWVPASFEEQLFAVGPFDPTVFLAVTAVLAVAALGACWWPARRAASSDPCRALREESPG
ncbi:MAG: ADOP family duplicated permease, partial [Holophagales bacterium]|nr:ADOP family duplicated permease [Holophagales bacterium]